jgi:hypothetical protein
MMGLVCWILGYLIVFLLVIYFWRQWISFGNVFNQVFLLKWIYLSTVVVFLVGLYTTVMTWGHFKVSKHDKDVVGSDAGLIDDFRRDRHDGILVFIKSQLISRRDKLIQFKGDLDKDPQSKGKIPPFVLNQFETEIRLIDSVLVL